jgi:nanoRNase/pAp phosphatase (c-di-AMP/oligoRNAs hydrolase)
MDTLNLARNVTALDIEMLGYLFPYCDPDTLADLERNNMEFTDLKAYGAAIENIELYDKVGISYVPFTCPAALVAILSDFILALVEVEVAIVASFRKDGIKLSVRSEDPEVHAGNLLHKALLGIGNGGGHATMGGGFISRERVPELGNYPQDRIRELFLDVLMKE